MEKLAAVLFAIALIPALLIGVAWDAVSWVCCWAWRFLTLEQEDTTQK